MLGTEIVSLVATTSLGIDVEFSMPKEMAEWFNQNARMVESGVQVVGDAAAYALVWEWGNTRQTKQGPRTVLGTNPAGDSVWLSSQAPRGWIALNEPEMWKVIEDKIKKIDFAGQDEFHVNLRLEELSQEISQAFMEILWKTAPVDSGDLSNSLEIVMPGDPILDVVEDSYRQMADGTTDFGGLLIDTSFGDPLNK